ncbi:hypothetical protein [Streptomyces sp. NPDC006527]|uniref:hypothetical protein n=1 Tax=Streptomyces sp. NPDC006527 TaxID=3364749 RepID=UPI00368A9BF1
MPVPMVSAPDQSDEKGCDDPVGHHGHRGTDYGCGRDAQAIAGEVVETGGRYKDEEGEADCVTDAGGDS